MSELRPRPPDQVLEPIAQETSYGMTDQALKTSTAKDWTLEDQPDRQQRDADRNQNKRLRKPVPEVADPEQPGSPWNSPNFMMQRPYEPDNWNIQLVQAPQHRRQRRTGEENGCDGREP